MSPNSQALLTPKFDSLSSNWFCKTNFPNLSASFGPQNKLRTTIHIIPWPFSVTAHIILKCIKPLWLLLALWQIRSESGTSPLCYFPDSLSFKSRSRCVSQLFVLPTGVALNKVNVRRSSVRQVKLNYTHTPLVLVPYSHNPPGTHTPTCE